ncbi:MAG: fumarylacetoacetate hydrolase family protein [Thermoprotei archaeon]
MRIAFASLKTSSPNMWLVTENGAYMVADVCRSIGLEASPASFTDPATFFQEGLHRKLASVSPESTGVEPTSLSTLRLLPPVSKSSKIMCAAVNYRLHAAETKGKIPSAPYFFLKPSSALTGPYDDLVKAKVSSKMDYEIELVAIIGERAKYVDPARAIEHVGAYMVGNDVSYRDFQFSESHPDLLAHGKDWVLGKGMDTSFPTGPFAVTVDEIGHGPFDLECRVNGTRVQHSSTGDMIYDVSKLVARACTGVTLHPGDVISTGTPSGVALGGGFRFLEPGDVVEGSISKIGSIRNRVVEDTGLPVTS